MSEAGFLVNERNILLALAVLLERHGPSTVSQADIDRIAFGRVREEFDGDATLTLAYEKRELSS